MGEGLRMDRLGGTSGLVAREGDAEIMGQPKAGPKAGAPDRGSPRIEARDGVEASRAPAVDLKPESGSPGADAIKPGDAVAADDEARKPSLWRSVLEVFEFIGRMLPGIGSILNLISACIRVAGIATKLLSGEHMSAEDWKREGLRLVGDVIGIFVPPMGAIANTGFNIWWGEEDGAQLMGGINRNRAVAKIPFAGKYLYDEAPVESAFSYWPSQAFGYAKRFVGSGDDGASREVQASSGGGAPALSAPRSFALAGA